MTAGEPDWKDMARAMLPDAYQAEEHETVILLFIDLMPVLKAAHDAADQSTLLRIYGFAEWCARHRDQKIWNGAGVAFYEHLFDRGTPIDEIVPWLTPETYADVKGLFSWRLGEEKARNIEQAMHRRKKTHSMEIRSLINKTKSDLG